MPACTTTSKSRFSIILLSLSLILFGSLAQAQPGAPAAPPKKEESNLFDQSSPYLDYGDFNTTEDESEDTLYFQYGRFFGVSLGGGYQTALGNRGKLWDACFPRLDIRVHYWFNFNFAMDFGVFFANHSFVDYHNQATTAKMIGYGLHLKYYFDVRDSSAALTFSNPFLMAGIGAMSKDESNSQSTTPVSDSTLSLDLGGGLEFPISYKKTYFILEGLYHTQSFSDSSESNYLKTRNLTDLNGGFFTLLGHFMFVW